MTLEARVDALTRLARRALEEIRGHDPMSRAALEINAEYEALMLSIKDLRIRG